MSVCFRVKRGLPLMDSIMKNGLFQTALCLVGISAPVNCQTNWKNSKVRSVSTRCCQSGAPLGVKIVIFPLQYLTLHFV